MDGYYKNKFEESNKKNKEDDSYNKFLLKMKLLREKKAKELMELKQQYIDTLNNFKESEESESDKTGAVNINGEDKSILFLGTDNMLYYPNAAMSIGAFRAFFRLNNGILCGENPKGVSK